MVTMDEVRDAALSLPGAEEGAEPATFHVRVTERGAERAKGFAWRWLERVHPKQARVPNLRVLAVRTSSVAERDLMIDHDPAVFFTEPHYNGYPAVLIRLDAVPTDVLHAVLLEGWRHVAPRDLRALID